MDTGVPQGVHALMNFAVSNKRRYIQSEVFNRRMYKHCIHVDIDVPGPRPRVGFFDQIYLHLGLGLHQFYVVRTTFVSLIIC